MTTSELTTASNATSVTPIPRPLARNPVFATTHWSVVLTAGQLDTSRAEDALARLCQAYWYPIYIYVRRRGYSAHDAQDLTQGFFAHLLEQRALAKADANRGRFRSFMLSVMNHFLAHEWQKMNREKRGKGHTLLSLDLAAAEERFDLEPADDLTPDKIFEKQWALALLDKVLGCLEAEYRDEGKANLFATLKPTLMGARESQPYLELAARLQMSADAVKVAVHRLRRRYRELVRREVADTLDASQDIEEEMKHLFAALAGK